jgi:hypothetical protein
MPYYHFREIWTPLKLVGLRFFIEGHDNTLWVKWGNRHRRPLQKKKYAKLHKSRKVS